MKIYFSASAYYKKNHSIYQRIIAYLEEKDHDVFQKVLSQHLPVLAEVSSQDIKQWFDQWSSYVKDSDCVVIEGSYPTTIHIGFELGMILARGKPVILLHEADKDPVFINNYYSSRLIKSEYCKDNLEEVLSWCLVELQHLVNRRFTFFLSLRRLTAF